MKKVHVLGTGCPKCRQLTTLVEKVSAENNLEIDLVKVTDMNEILSFGVMMTPGLVIDGEVKISGRVPNNKELIELLK